MSFYRLPVTNAKTYTISFSYVKVSVTSNFICFFFFLSHDGKRLRLGTKINDTKFHIETRQNPTEIYRKRNTIQMRSAKAVVAGFCSLTRAPIARGLTGAELRTGRGVCFETRTPSRFKSSKVKHLLVCTRCILQVFKNYYDRPESMYFNQIALQTCLSILGTLRTVYRWRNQTITPSLALAIQHRRLRTAVPVRTLRRCSARTCTTVKTRR